MSARYLSQVSVRGLNLGQAALIVLSSPLIAGGAEGEIATNIVSKRRQFLLTSEHSPFRLPTGENSHVKTASQHRPQPKLDIPAPPKPDIWTPPSKPNLADEVQVPHQSKEHSFEPALIGRQSEQAACDFQHQSFEVIPLPEPDKSSPVEPRLPPPCSEPRRSEPKVFTGVISWAVQDEYELEID